MSRIAVVTTPTGGETLRDRVLRAAAAMTIADGWSKVTMARLADEVGVSRQSVYNTFGNKPSLARELVLAELNVFLTQVTGAFDANPDDPVAAIHDASLAVLRLGRENPLLRGVVAGSRGADSELLPLLTTDSSELLTIAKDTVIGGLRRFDLALGPDDLETAIDVVVRTVLSHVIHPSGTPEETAAGIEWVTGRLLHPAQSHPGLTALN
nr:TetR/AcrR family transcriptional regulator [Flexivirga oryzae]